LLYTFGVLFADAATSTSSSPSSNWTNFVPIILMIAIFYFLLIRPQQKKEKDRKSMISEIKEGDKVLTSGGIYGVVSNVKDENIVVVKIANNTKVEFSKSSIQVKL
jgi:preprotein translocase subunit YajC